jgi:predicted branched-subunit amino acid permease
MDPIDARVDGHGWLRTVAPALPIGIAISVFGTVYGAAAAPLLGPGMVLATSLLIFSGSLQFATLGLVAAGAGPATILLTAFVLNTRHLVLGALLRPSIGSGALRRAGLAWFLVDESFGLAYTARHRAAVTLLLAGIVCYVSWQIGTAIGVLGAELATLEGVAGAIFTVLFIGLAAVTSLRLGLALRAAAAGLMVLVIALLLPDLRAIAPVLAALVVAVPPDRLR